MKKQRRFPLHGVIDGVNRTFTLLTTDFEFVSTINVNGLPTDFDLGWPGKYTVEVKLDEAPVVGSTISAYLIG